MNCRLEGLTVIKLEFETVRRTETFTDLFVVPEASNATVPVYTPGTSWDGWADTCKVAGVVPPTESTWSQGAPSEVVAETVNELEPPETEIVAAGGGACPGW